MNNNSQLYKLKSKGIILYCLLSMQDHKEKYIKWKNKKNFLFENKF